MIKLNKNPVTITLILSSIALLIALQFLWLRNVYNQALNHFTTETNILFRNTVLVLQDSLIRKSIIPYHNDSLPAAGWGKIMIRDSIQVDSSPREFFNDSLNEVKNGVKIQVYFENRELDTVGRILKPILSDFQPGHSPKNFLIRIGTDSLNADSVSFYFRKELKKAGINMPFSILTMKQGVPHIQAYKKSTVTDFTHLSPVWQYAAMFENTSWFIFSGILPQILFSVFLTSLIIISFYIMYRNIRSQQQLMELKNEFIGNITHELKTPVATVSVAIEALKNFNIINDREKAGQYLDIALKELNRLNLMTDKILTASVFEQKGIEYEIESVDLDRLILEVLDSMKLVAETRKAIVNYEKSGENFKMMGGSAHLGNVIYNLLDNALKYSSPGVNIIIRMVAGHGKIELSVKDNGIGIPVEYHRKIFEKFSRVPGQDIHNVKGYGLGLNYVEKVVRSHNGHIKLVSKPGEGSCFTITFKLGK